MPLTYKLHCWSVGQYTISMTRHSLLASSDIDMPLLNFDTLHSAGITEYWPENTATYQHIIPVNTETKSVDLTHSRHSSSNK